MYDQAYILVRGQKYTNLINVLHNVLRLLQFMQKKIIDTVLCSTSIFTTHK